MRVSHREVRDVRAPTASPLPTGWQSACRAFGKGLFEIAAAAAALAMPAHSIAHLSHVTGAPTESTRSVVKPPLGSLSGKRAEVMLRAQPQAAAVWVDTPSLVPPDQFLNVNTSALAADGALTHALIGDLPEETQALARMLLATDASGPLVIALQNAVKDGVSGAVRQAAIRTALAKALPFEAVRDVLTTDASPRVQQVLSGLQQLGTQSSYALSLQAAVIAVALDPQLSSWTSAERDQAVMSALSQRGAYMAIFQHRYTDDPTVADATVTDEQCSVEGAVAFRLSAPINDLQGCHRTVSFADGSTPIQLVIPKPLVEQNLLAEDVARGLALLPADVRQHIARVVLNPKNNPDDAHWQAEPGYSADHRSSMTASTESGTITIYPSQNQARGMLRSRGLSVAMLHEVGHLVHSKVKANEAWHAAWDTARQGDDARASNYAFSSDHEDFAETFAIYISTRGTADHDAYRLLMPQRFAVLDASLSSLLAMPAPDAVANVS
jgi:hypothetical protein